MPITLQFYIDKANRDVKGGFDDPGQLELVNDWNSELGFLEGIEIQERFGKLDTLNNKRVYKFTEIVPGFTSGTTDASGNTGVNVADADGDFDEAEIIVGYIFHNTTDSTKSTIKTIDSTIQLTLDDSGVTGNSKEYLITTPSDPDVAPIVRIPKSVHIRDDTILSRTSSSIFRRRRTGFVDTSEIGQGIKGQRGIPFYPRLETLEFFENPGKATYDVVFSKEPRNISSLAKAETEIDVPQEMWKSIEIFIKMTYEEGTKGVSPQWRPAWEEFKSQFEMQQRFRGNDTSQGFRS